MNSSLELAPGATDHPLPEWNADTVQALLDQLNRQAAETTRLNAALKLAEGKNQALTLELAHLRRLRFGAKSEA